MSHNQEITNNQNPITNSLLGYWLLKFGAFLVIATLVIGNCAFASTKAYDGIWFLGFNLKQGVFKNSKVRYAVNHSINKEVIIENVISGEVTPASIIPPTMIGYDPKLKPYKYNVSYGKKLMRLAGLPVTDKRLKNLTLLHTDGVKTIEVAKIIQKSLRKLGMKVTRIQAPYKDQKRWVKELKSGKYDMFLLGYKAGVEQLFTSEAETKADSYSLVEPLFDSQGYANFTGYNNPKVDKLLSQVADLNPALASERNDKLKQVNRIIYRELPVLVLFYIEKL